MGSGHRAIRQMIKSDCRWTDKASPRHKHEFTQHVIIAVKYPEKGYTQDFVCYYDAMKCKYCSSFKAIPKQGSLHGLLKDNEIDKKLPVIWFGKSNQRIGFDGIFPL